MIFDNYSEIFDKWNKLTYPFFLLVLNVLVAFCLKPFCFIRLPMFTKVKMKYNSGNKTTCYYRKQHVKALITISIAPNYTSNSIIYFVGSTRTFSLYFLLYFVYFWLSFLHVFLFCFFLRFSFFLFFLVVRWWIRKGDWDSMLRSKFTFIKLGKVAWQECINAFLLFFFFFFAFKAFEIRNVLVYRMKNGNEVWVRRGVDCDRVKLNILFFCLRSENDDEMLKSNSLKIAWGGL